MLILASLKTISAITEVMVQVVICMGISSGGGKPMPVLQPPFLVFTASMGEAMLPSSRVLLLQPTPAPAEVTEERAVVSPPPQPLPAFGVGVVEVADSSSSSSISGNRGG